ncbi:CaiB/BaiF CoA transferase family protein [Actinomadura mexicana]|uniref:Crotonobetainyl-CoA:carnitine CoA-transferase CaiB n=1 Tax=Actinomadura mexicana TaxID=134959 RepID=A0A238XAG0_9ACTN|nr:CaiB/BaiF CoA-transferase family protein [Actinomadura mexicana]SNR56026.1 Crotonobetainyl-CoA:carnitine CoA-transferase CaiB [Actinomadura mexicana]
MTPVRPLSGVRVLDLSTLLPGPLATLLLAEAGADVVKIERPGPGDEMRTYRPVLGEVSANYAVLNRGKRGFAADLKNAVERDRVLALASEADIVVEQFRPGVTDRLGVGYEEVRALNPRVIYCSITGYGQRGPNANRAGHDLNYLAETGLLGVVVDGAGKPPIPPTVLADIAGGTYPAVMNILLALRQRDVTGTGCHLDISMTHNLHLLAYGYFATHQGGGGWPVPGKELLTGGSPRYQVYATSDGRHVAVAALEQKFWERLAGLLELPAEYLDERGRESEVIEVVGDLIGARPAEHWRKLFDGEDVCTVVVATFEEATAAGLVDTDSDDRLVGQGFDVGTLPSPVDPALRRPPGALGPAALDPLPDGRIWSER